MMSNELARAREYEERESRNVNEEDRPVFHFTPLIGWLNDPNGFSFYNGKYHLFYQYHPYGTFWGPMHWGHAASDDMIRWEYLPASLAPDTDYDGAGCFSGSAVTMPDGRQLLMYTGVSEHDRDPDGKWRETQSIAVGDGLEYTKYENNPVLSDEDLPEGGDIYEFRDPYIWTEDDGTYRAVIGNAFISEGSPTELNLYKSEDGFRWERGNLLFRDTQRIGIMWECPNFLRLDGTQVLIASPMDMEAEEADGSIRFPKGNNVCYILGDYDEETERFSPYTDEDSGYAIYHPVDCGLDFYAPQVRVMPDGRCIMIGWMMDPKMSTLYPRTSGVFGQMTVPRELFMKGRILCQRPIRELDAFRTDKTSYSSIKIGGEIKNGCSANDEGSAGRFAHDGANAVRSANDEDSAGCSANDEESAGWLHLGDGRQSPEFLGFPRVRRGLA